MAPRKIILRSRLSLGDLVVLTAAVRDLHRAQPGRFQIDVRTCWPDLWEHNPGITPLNEYDPEVEILECYCPLVHRSEAAARHYINGFLEYLANKLRVHAPLTEFRGDIHFSAAERAAPSLIAKRTGRELPFWLICAGGKDDFTVKWWDPKRHQAVVDHFRGRLLFVQVGDHQQHHHPLLRGVIDLRGQTSPRELARLVYHSRGGVCGVTGLMHLAAAVPVKEGRFPNRPCVVVAGGREPAHWEAYPGHHYVSTVGMLPCCARGGCWKSRVEPLGDGEPQDEQLCVDVRAGLPRCMDLISAAEVIRRIEGCIHGGAAEWLTRAQSRAALRAIDDSSSKKTRAPQEPRPAWPPAEPLNLFNAARAAEEFIGTIPRYPGGYAGRGIVICGGGVRMFTNAWVCIRMLRRLGCRLPIELWHWSELELDASMRGLVEPLGVECIDATTRSEWTQLDSLWALKPLALVGSKFKEALLLDADNVPVANPEALFEAAAFRRTGAALWPDFGRLPRDSTVWRVFDVPYRDEPQVESGQVLVDKPRCWRALQLCLWYNQHSNFFYKHVHGDKETFHLAFRRLRLPYAMTSKPIQRLDGTMCQHDFNGRRMFQHRNMAKWRLFGNNPRVRGFLFEEECLEDLRQLGAVWNGRIRRPGTSKRGPSTEGPPADWASLPEVRLFASVTSCVERNGMRQATLERLAQTDWGTREVHVQMDPRRSPDREENIAHNGWCALQAGLKSDAEYILYLEDDLSFNQHLRQNLQHWPRLRARQITLATLYNPMFAELGWDIPPTAFAVDPRRFMGTQALLISRETAEYFIEHWFEGPVPLDLKMAWLAARLKWPIFCHNPSLVQHEGRQSLWGGQFHCAPDFDAAWKAGPEGAA